ncbi:NUDIX hydrolase [Mucilaginibacter ginkgonis]|uniref:NUDIX domain-containing protein n=1 Tax=Mucilaginibacter ginkgonis TaxID=2682091 RepID=A0A6I4HYC2_9SPHI|nr:NUDIX domain-containing protein [Mucilaginibacter ginkgonis]QQL50394.1 NUDIX domain-containing protein [Mucilaginibacter ginkgonis]
MARNYKIYINHKTLIIAESAPLGLKKAQKMSEKPFDFGQVYLDVLRRQGDTFLVVTEDPKAFLKKIIKNITLIEASGGMVKNKKGEYLFIYRNDSWDLPKGKLEKDETTREGGVREVEEECGIEIESSGKKICKTYHAYISKGEVVLKKTHWYKMKYTGKGKLKPQLEEGITEVRWFDKDNTSEILANTFPSIVEVMKESGMIKENLAPPSE